MNSKLAKESGRSKKPMARWKCNNKHLKITVQYYFAELENELSVFISNPKIKLWARPSLT